MTTVLITEWYPGALIEAIEHERDGQGERVVTAVATDDDGNTLWESDAQPCALDALVLGRKWVGA